MPIYLQPKHTKRIYQLAHRRVKLTEEEAAAGVIQSLFTRLEQAKNAISNLGLDRILSKIIKDSDNYVDDNILESRTANDIGALESAFEGLLDNFVVALDDLTQERQRLPVPARSYHRRNRKTYKMTARNWDQIHAEYMRLMDDFTLILNKSAKLRDEIAEYRKDGDLEDQVYDEAQRLVDNLVKASSGDPDGSFWWILQHSDDFKKREQG